MHIKKQRLLTPGPTPLLPKALHAMMDADIHHRTEDFRRLYKSVLADLNELLGTKNDVLVLVSSGSGGMDASVSNCFSAGDKVIVCTAGKFGERWVGITKAYGLDAVVLEEPYGKSVSVARVEQALKDNPDAKGVFVQASETSTGAAHDVQAMAAAVKKTDAIFVVDAITGLGTMPLDIDGWGIDICIGGSQKAFMIPPGLGFLSISEKAWEMTKTAKLPHYYFSLDKEKKAAATGDSAWTPNTAAMLGFAEALKYIKGIGMANLIENAQMLAAATRDAAQVLGLKLFAPESPASSVTAICAPEGMDSGVIVKGFRDRFGSIIANGQGTHEGPDFPDRPSGLFRLFRSVRRDGAARADPARQRAESGAGQFGRRGAAGLRQGRDPELGLRSIAPPAYCRPLSEDR